MMNMFLTFFIRTFITIPITITTWLFSYFAFDQSFWLSGLIGLGGGVLTHWLVGQILLFRYLRTHGLTRKEYRYIKKNLDEAKGKIARLHKALLSIRHFPSLKQRMEFVKVTKKIYRLSKKEPRRFYQAEQFYFSHLDSALELSEKYVFLDSQPAKNSEITFSLRETKRTLAELIPLVERDLHKMVEDDVDTLNFEIDVAKHSIKSKKDSILDERRR